MTVSASHKLQAGFASVERVVADPLRFKLRLGIGEDAYRSLLLKKRIQEVWDMGGMAATGAAVASSTTVATTFFAPTGFLAMLGFGAAVTPIGWVIAAAVGSAGAYYGVTRLYGRYAGSRVHVIPNFINTPIDILGASLLDLMGALAIRVANIDGEIHDDEIAVITDYFVAEWGFDPAYVAQALPVLRASMGTIKIRDLAAQLARFQADNPDCRPEAMRSGLMVFLREVAEADGRLDEREELALDAIENAMREETDLTLAKIGQHVTGAAGKAVQAVTGVFGTLGSRLPKGGPQKKAPGAD